MQKQIINEDFVRKDDERKVSVIFQILPKNKGNSTAIARIFREDMESSSLFYPLYLSCKGLKVSDKEC